jgi:hypothetical protein
MLKTIMAVVFLLMLSVSYAFPADIDCVAGYCQGWSIKSESRTPNGAAVFKFINNTESAAFELILVINVYDYFGKYITKLTWKDSGPLQRGWAIVKTFRCPDQMYKWTGEIYYKTGY